MMVKDWGHIELFNMGLALSAGVSMGVERLGSQDPKVNGIYRLYVSGVSTLAALLLALLAYNAKSVLDKLEVLSTLAVQTNVQVQDQGHRLTRLEDYNNDLLQRVSKIEGGQRPTPGVR